MAERRESTSRGTGEYGACQRCGERAAKTRVLLLGAAAGQPHAAAVREVYLCDECARAMPRTPAEQAAFMRDVGRPIT